MSKLSSIPYTVPAPVKALGEPEEIFQPGTSPSGTGKLVSLLLAVASFLFLLVGGMLLVCAVHPFGSSAPPAAVCWIAGAALVLLGGGSAYGTYHYFTGAGDNKQTYLIYPNCLVELFPTQHRIVPWEKLAPSKSSVPGLTMFRFSTGTPKDLGFDGTMPRYEELVRVITSRAGRQAGSAANVQPVAPMKPASAAGKKEMTIKVAHGTGEPKLADGEKVSMENALLHQPALQVSMGSLVEALSQAAPEHHAVLHLIAEVRKTNGKTSILFTHGTPVVLSEYSTLVSDSIAHAAYALVDALLQQNDKFPGFEVVLRKTAAKSWDLQFHALNESAPQWRNLPRYPLRVCGYGFSLAPVTNTEFRWTRTANPPGVVASARRDPKAPGKQVQIMLSDAGSKLTLGQGVTKAEEVIEVSEGPHTSKWTIETPIFHTVWPQGLDLRYPLASKTRFDLLGPDNTLIYVQGPAASQPQILESMAAEGQAVVAQGKTSGGHAWIELGYEVQGANWRQRHYERKVSQSKSLLVSAQSLEAKAEKTFQASDEVANSLAKPTY